VPAAAGERAAAVSVSKIRRFTFDYAWVEQRTAIEIDGGTWKPGGGRHGQDCDREKLNLATLEGWKVLRFSGAMLHNDPAGCIDQLRALLERRT
jgi:very-short-patch-repair endonuclease